MTLAEDDPGDDPAPHEDAGALAAALAAASVSGRSLLGAMPGARVAKAVAQAIPPKTARLPTRAGSGEASVSTRSSSPDAQLFPPTAHKNG